MPPTEAVQQSVLDQLRQAVGTCHVCTAQADAMGTAADLSTYEQDWRGRQRGLALAVVRPGSTQEVAAVMRICAASQTAIVPQGGNTGLVLGSIPDETGTQIVLSLGRMNQVRAIDSANLSLTAEAGCLLHNVQQGAQEAGLLFPLSLGSQGSCTLGGNLATNAGGTQVLRYGNARDLCLGLEAVTAQGEIWHGLSGLRKDNTGYDLRHLLIGSEGTLGVITAATMKLYPRPAATLTAWVALPSMSAAVALLGLAQQHLGAGLTGFEVMGQYALALVVQHCPALRVPLYQSTPYSVLLEYADTESEEHAHSRLELLLGDALAQGCAADAVLAQNLTQANQMWQVRESIPLAQAQEGLNIKHDISLPISRIAQFCQSTDALLARELPGVRLVNFGHLGDGNLHYNVQAPRADAGSSDAAAFVREHEARVNALVYAQVHSMGGSISAEHGIGSLKAGTLPSYKCATALGMMRAIKQALDPHNILNPGRVLSPTPQSAQGGLHR